MDSPQLIYRLTTKDTNGANVTNDINIEDKSNSLVISYIYTSLVNRIDDEMPGYTCHYFLKA